MKRPQRAVPPLHFAQGLLMGGADVIPGVSGGTMALIVGIYERLLQAVSTLFSAVAAVPRGDLAGARRALGEVEWRFFLPLAFGALTAIVAGSRIILPLMERYPAEARGLFFGLVAASVAIPWMRIERPTAIHYLLVPAAAVAAYFLVGLPPTEVQDPSMLRVFLSAAVAICAMILPGVSGSFLLAVLGMYTVTLTALHDFDLVYILVFAGGAGVGLGIFSKLLNWLLEHHHDVTMAALVGLMAGSLRALWPWQEEDRSMHFPQGGEPVASVLLLLAAGFVFVTALTWWGKRRIEAQANPHE
jgi:putative membrane protein